MGLGLAGLAAMLLGSNKSVRKAVQVSVDTLRTEAGRLAFKLSLKVLPISSSAGEFADDLLAVSESSGISPFILASIIDHESGFGERLTPKGVTGVGDRLKRWVTDADLVGNYSFARPQGLLTGRSVAPGERFPDDYARRLYGETAKVRRYEVNPPKAPGAGAAGWGIGIGQIDYATSGHRAWIESGKWKEPRESVAKVAEVLQSKMNAIKRALPNLSGDDLMRAGLAAYNRGEGNVIAKIKAGQSPDAGNPNGAYGADRFATAQKAANDYRGKVA